MLTNATFSCKKKEDEEKEEEDEEEEEEEEDYSCQMLLTCTSIFCMCHIFSTHKHT